MRGGEDKSVVEIKVAKGVKKTVIIKDLKFESYVKCLFENVQFEHLFDAIRSVSHHVFTSRQFKISLSPFDDKRWLLDPVNSLPYGHHSILQN